MRIPEIADRLREKAAAYLDSELAALAEELRRRPAGHRAPARSRPMSEELAHQIRAARALVRWSARELAERAGVSLPTIQRIEAADGLPSTSVKTLDAIRRALEEAGVEFTPGRDDNGGPGVRLKQPR